MVNCRKLSNAFLKLEKQRDNARFQEFNKCKTDKCRKAKDKKADRLDKKLGKAINKFDRFC